MLKFEESAPVLLRFFRKVGLYATGNGELLILRIMVRICISFYVIKNYNVLNGLFLEHKKWIKIQPRDACTYLEYHFIDKDGNEIK